MWSHFLGNHMHMLGTKDSCFISGMQTYGHISIAGILSHIKHTVLSWLLVACQEHSTIDVPASDVAISAR